MKGRRLKVTYAAQQGYRMRTNLDVEEFLNEAKDREYIPDKGYTKGALLDIQNQVYLDNQHQFEIDHATWEVQWTTYIEITT